MVMGNIIFVGVRDVEKMHRRLIDEFGGLHGIRDMNLLESLGE
jgi:hypothetical protein